MWDKQSQIAFEALQSQNILFNPFEMNEDNDLPLDSIDPDIHYYNNHCNMTLNSCDYYIEDTFN